MKKITTVLWLIYLKMHGEKLRHFEKKRLLRGLKRLNGFYAHDGVTVSMEEYFISKLKIPGNWPQPCLKATLVATATVNEKKRLPLAKKDIRKFYGFRIFLRQIQKVMFCEEDLEGRQLYIKRM